MPSDEFLLTYEFLGMMLGVQRASVSLVMTALQRAGAIHHALGRVKILNRQALHGQVCECYEISKHEFDRFLTWSGNWRKRVNRIARLCVNEPPQSS